VDRHVADQGSTRAGGGGYGDRDEFWITMPNEVYCVAGTKEGGTFPVRPISSSRKAADVIILYMNHCRATLACDVSLGNYRLGVGAVVAAVASRFNDRSRRHFEVQRWRAEFYLRPKLDAMRNLHAALVRSHYEINLRAKSRMPQNIQE